MTYSWFYLPPGVEGWLADNWYPVACNFFFAKIWPCLRFNLLTDPAVESAVSMKCPADAGLSAAGLFFQIFRNMSPCKDFLAMLAWLGATNSSSESSLKSES